jgi:hypothetical protein
MSPNKSKRRGFGFATQVSERTDCLTKKKILSFKKEIFVG